MGKYTSAAVLIVRLMGLFWVVAGFCMLVANVTESATEFNPSFIGYYLQSQALRPLLAIGAGLMLLFFSRPIGCRLARGLDHKNDA